MPMMMCILICGHSAEITLKIKVSQKQCCPSTANDDDDTPIDYTSSRVEILLRHCLTFAQIEMYNFLKAICVRNRTDKLI